MTALVGAAATQVDTTNDERGRRHIRVTIVFDNPRERDRTITFADLFQLTWTLTTEQRENWVDGGTYPVWILTVTDERQEAA